MCEGEKKMKLWNVFFIIAALIFLSCSKSGPDYCINAFDCPEGYECIQGLCVEPTGTNDNTANNDNEQHDNAVIPDNSIVPDESVNDDVNEDEDVITDEESEIDNETGDEDCSPHSCGLFCSKVVTNECNTNSDCRCEPVKHFDNLADPDIYRDSDELYFISGTGVDTNSLVVSMSSDLVVFEEAFTYIPSDADENFDYCCIWAPEIYKNPEGFYTIYFSAKRVAQGEVCDCADVSNVTTFYAQYDETAVNFKTPALVDFGAGNPQSSVSPECVLDGCEKTIRIDSALFNDSGTEWFFWTWFQEGNYISSIKMNEPANVINNFQPTLMEGNINEGVDVFKRDGKYYLFFSVNPFDGDYAMKYVVAETMDELVRARIPRWFSTPVKDNGGIRIQTHGHSSVVERYGDHYIFYHQGRFDTQGILTGRDTYKSRLIFRGDGSLQMLNTIDIGWSDAGENFQYMLDVKPRDGDWVSPCLGNAILSSNKKHTFTGICSTNSNMIVPKGSIEKIRLFYSDNGVWGEPNMVEIDYDGFSSDISISIPDKKFDHLKIRFAQQNTGDIYSIDIKVKDGGWLAPCIGSLTLSKPLSLSGDFAYTFNGTCLADPNSGTVVPIENIESVRVCSDKDDTWMTPVCFEKTFDGNSRYIEVW